MNPVFGARRRAEEFNSMLEGATSTTGSSGLPDARYADLLSTVATLRQTSRATVPVARPEFVADLRSRLLLAAEGALAPVEVTARTAKAAPQKRSPRERRLAAAVGGFAIVSATASMAVAAQTALPGDTLYPLKRAIENAHTGVQSGADDKGSTLLGNATGRLAEVDELSRAGDQDARVIAETLDDFVQQANEASDLLLSDFQSTGHAGSIEELRSFTAASIEALKQLQGVIPTEVRGSLIAATNAVHQIDELALSVCPTCSDLPLTEVPLFARGAKIPSLLNDLLTENDEAAAPPASHQTKTGDKKGGSTQVAQPGGPEITPPAVKEPTEPATDGPEPILPGTTDEDDTKGQHGHGGTKDPLGDLTAGASASDDPIGDLLGATGDLVDGVLNGGKTKP